MGSEDKAKKYIFLYSLSFWNFHMTQIASIYYLYTRLWTAEIWVFWQYYFLLMYKQSHNRSISMRNWQQLCIDWVLLALLCSMHGLLTMWYEAKVAICDYYLLWLLFAEQMYIGCVNAGVIQFHVFCKAQLVCLHIMGRMNQTVKQTLGLKV